MMSDLISLVDEIALFQTSSARNVGPSSGLTLGFLVPLVFTLNVAVAILAWFIVELFAN
jgi:hypothetical protein